MSSTLSVSKGVFVYKNGAKATNKRSRKHKASKTEDFSREPLWFQRYKSLWTTLKLELEDVKDDLFTNVLRNLISYLKQCYKSPETEIPSAALLTGINMPDHSAQFNTLGKLVKLSTTSHLVYLTSENCQNMKQLIENLINQLVNTEQASSASDDENEDNSNIKYIKKSQSSFAALKSWYETLYSFNNTLEVSPTKRQRSKSSKKIILVIIPDFESFNEKLLQDFILIANSHLNILPFVFVFGVATSVTALHHSLPYHVSSKVKIQVFHSTRSTHFLNSILENVFLTPNCPFQLGDKVFRLFSDIFLFYNLSVSDFIQNLKYAMLEHFSYGNAMALCKRKKIKKVIRKFEHADLENVRRLMSFRAFVENQSAENRLNLLTDDEYFKTALYTELIKMQSYLHILPVFVRCLRVLVEDLPRAPLGKQVREIHSVVISTDLTKSKEFHECFQLLQIQSKDEFVPKIEKIVNLLVDNATECEPANELFKNTVEKLENFIDQLQNKEPSMEIAEEQNNSIDTLITGQMARLQLKAVLLEKTNRSKTLSHYEKTKQHILEFLSKLFETHLVQPSKFYFHEIFFFNNMSVQNQIIGSHRAAIHNALNDPNFYLQCSCCKIDDDSQILRTMPDISIVYKLHLECGKMINLYDWLQAFLSIVDPDDVDDDKKRVVKPDLQARFTQAIAELEYLGFIKSSKRKTDHVARLTWGG